MKLTREDIRKYGTRDEIEFLREYKSISQSYEFDYPDDPDPDYYHDENFTDKVNQGTPFEKDRTFPKHDPKRFYSGKDRDKQMIAQKVANFFDAIGKLPGINFAGRATLRRRAEKNPTFSNIIHWFESESLPYTTDRDERMTSKQWVKGDYNKDSAIDALKMIAKDIGLNRYIENVREWVDQL